MMNYEQAVEWLNQPKAAFIRPGLESTVAMMHALSDPQDSLKYVHIAGTNGKGSTAAFLDSVLRTAGYKVGLYTSPYVERFTERIKVNGEEIPDEDLCALTEKVREYVEALPDDPGLIPTAFEMVTAVAFMYFKQVECDIVILEVGLGGKLDATNIINVPEVACIASIDYDHMDYFGDTLTLIAGEKAGIIKKDGRVVSYPQVPEAKAVIDATVEETGASCYEVSKADVELLESGIGGQKFNYKNSDGITRTYEIGLLGAHQLLNASVAIEGVEVLRKRGFEISDDALLAGIANAHWIGRLEVVSRKPLVIVDAAHNPQGAGSMADALKKLFPDNKVTFIFGVLADKDFRVMLDIVEPLAGRFLTVTPNSPRALSSDKLAAILEKDGFETECFDTVTQALEHAIQAYPDDVIVAFGSLYYIGEVTSYFKKH